ncbi:MAG: aminomethyltransferase family protein [Alphaproteobacteria bacterium]|nr:aminomethyltransferase family protein [Alphaproteobacteria bacterium]
MTTKPLYQEPLLETPFHARTASLNQTNEWGRWAGYTTVNCYTDLATEYFALRHAATLFDVSPMIKYRIAGADAERYMNRLLTRDIRKLKPDRVAYAVWCNDDGKVLDDGTVFRLGESEFLLYAQERHLAWLQDSAIGYDVTVEDVSESIAGLALQGPLSATVLKAMAFDGIADLKPFGIARYDVSGTPLTVSRTGFTGDLGYELWIDPDGALELWDRLMAAGSLHRLTPIGSQALNLARIEAGFIQTNSDFVAADHAVRPTRPRSPFELGLDWLVDFDKGHFVGRRALLRERETGPRYRLVGLDIEGRKPAHDALIYHGKARQVGMVTSAMWSPTAKRNIALATLDAAWAEREDGLWAEIYVNKEIKWEKTAARCRIVARPFFDPPRRRATPAPDC